MMDRYVIDETCSCGATFRYDGSGPSSALQAARAWREQHQHVTQNGVLVVPEGQGLKVLSPDGRATLIEEDTPSEP